MIGLRKHLKNLQRYRDLLRELVIRDIKIKYRRSMLGVFWSFLNPLFTMIVMTMIFSTFFARNIDNFPVYLLTGRLLFDFYSHGSKAAMRSIRSNASLIKKVYVPKYIYPLSSVLSTFVTFAISLLVLFMVMLATRVQFTVNFVFFIIPIVYLLLFTLGAGLILACISVFFRDIEHLYDVFLVLLMYTTPIFYPAEIVPQQYQILLRINPLYHIVSAFREVLLFGSPPSLELNLTAMIISVSFFLTGIFVFYKKQDSFILFI